MPAPAGKFAGNSPEGAGDAEIVSGEDGNYTLAWNCIYALVKIGSNYAIEKLKALSKNPIPEIKNKAVQVGKSYGVLD